MTEPESLNIIIAIVGATATLAALILAMLAWLELGKLKQLRADIAEKIEALRAENYAIQKAQQLIIASYGVANTQARLSLLRTAVTIAPQSFNAYNALGYALLQAGDRAAALEAFSRATALHPQDKAGWCDLARLHISMGRADLAKNAAERAIKADASAREDILQDPDLQLLIKPRAS